MTNPICPGTRQPVVNRRRTRKGTVGGYAGRYGTGQCRVCGKSVVCHKDGSAVYHGGQATA